MSDYLRLRQICLVAPDLEPAVETIRDVFGVDVCFRDVNVAKYGLVNALFVFGHAFLEIVAPTREGTAAGRFLERSGGRGGYMAIFDCNDPQRRREIAERMGVRIAHVLDYPGYFGIQLHPRDGRATMLEFDHTEGGEALTGAYHPAGSQWQPFQRLDKVLGIPTIDVASPEPLDLAQHWATLMDRELDDGQVGSPRLQFELGAARFVPLPAGQAERLDAMHVTVPDPGQVLDAASRRGLDVADGRFRLYGVDVVPELPAH